jgi:hypothetical protein
MDLRRLKKNTLNFEFEFNLALTYTLLSSSLLPFPLELSLLLLFALDETYGVARAPLECHLGSIGVPIFKLPLC